jgi:hypothetical protein
LGSLYGKGNKKLPPLTEGIYLTKELANFQMAQQLYHQEVHLVKD